MQSKALHMSPPPALSLKNTTNHKNTSPRVRMHEAMGYRNFLPSCTHTRERTHEFALVFFLNRFNKVKTNLI